MVFYSEFISPAGKLIMQSDGASLTSLEFESGRYFSLPEDAVRGTLPVFDEVERWLSTYFHGTSPDFVPSIALTGTPFRMKVWDILRGIPFGSTVTYGYIASLLSCEVPKMSPQAIGGAVGHNPIALIIPCHRVTGANGSLTGYAAGLEKKSFLLEHERKYFRGKN